MSGAIDTSDLEDARLPPVLEQVLLTVSRELAVQLIAAIADPHEYIPSRIRHTTYALSNVLEQIDRQQTGRPS